MKSAALRRVRIGAFAGMLVGVFACSAGSLTEGERVDVVTVSGTDESPVAGTYYAEISPLTARMDLYPLHNGNTIFREELNSALAFTYGGNVSCSDTGTCTSALTLVTDQNKVTFITSGGQCFSNGLPCGSGTNAPAPTTFPCNVAGTWCGPLLLTSGLSFPLQNVVVQIGQTTSCAIPGTKNCIKGCQDTSTGTDADFGLCAATEPGKVDSASTSTLTSLIQSTMGVSASGCSFCFGNRDRAEALSRPGLRHVLMRAAGNTPIYTANVAIPLRNESDFGVTFTIRYGNPGFAASGSQIIQRNNLDQVRSCVVPGSSTIEVVGASFGPPSTCSTAGNLPAACPLSGTTPNTGYKASFLLTNGGTVDATTYQIWSDGNAKFVVPSPGGQTFTGAVRIVTPSGFGTTADKFSVCPSDPNCSDGTLNNNESDIDCGGTSPCTRCATGKICTVNTDCASNVCTAGICTPSSCFDGLKNGDESDIDCGGSCALKCALTKTCNSSADCQSVFCVDAGVSPKVCGEPGCADGQREGFLDEAIYTNIAGCSGGWVKTPPGAASQNTGLLALRACTAGTGDDSSNPTGSACAAVDLCQAGWGICGSSSGVINNLPSGEGDCSGALIGATGPLFFASLQSSNGNQTCGTTGNNDFWGCGDQGAAVPGGSVPSCGPFNRTTGDLCSSLGTGGWSCGTQGQQERQNVAKTSALGGGVLCCRGCGDGVQNNGESDVDCGGGACAPCAGGDTCTLNSDCLSQLCANGTCATSPTCTDGAQNQTETDVDCGGQSGCSKCVNTKSCVENLDCSSNICSTTNFRCGRQNGGTCGSDGDCQSAHCNAGTCVAATCFDGRKNGTETDIDCGGSCAANCAFQGTCSSNNDCQSALCIYGKCGQPGCSDGVREGFINDATYPDVAACSGGWSVQGLGTAASCARASGDDSPNQAGTACAADDLCMTGWAVCGSQAEYATKSAQANCTNAVPAGLTAFFATRQSSNGSNNCNAAGTNDFWGCGNYGLATACGALERTTGDLCSSLTSNPAGTGWNCGTNGNQEILRVTKASSTGGGVICCRQ